MYQPAIPLTGIGGWKFLQATYDRQFEGFSNSASVKNDSAYLTEKMSSPMAIEDFLGDKRLLRIALTAHDLAGEEWKGGFIRKVMEESADPESTFLQRLNNAEYTAFSKAFILQDGKVSIDADTLAAVADEFEAVSFRLAVGDVDESMRLSLNYEARISTMAPETSSDETILYRLLGSVPMRTILEGALNLPQDMRQLDIDQQAAILKTKLQDAFRINKMSELASSDVVDQVIQRYHAMESVRNGPSATTPGMAALTLLQGASGFGEIASQNLFLSQF